ncbi:MAG: thioredoxin family protein [Pseudomonadota bacterium]
MRLLLCTLAALLSLTQLTYAKPVDGGHALVELIAEREAVQPGEMFFAAFDMRLDRAWHVYWRNPGDAGLPPEVDHWDGDAGEMVGDFIWPIPHELPVVAGEIMDYGYDNRLVLPFSVQIPDTASASISLSGRLSYLICKEVCIPEEVDFSLNLPVEDQSKVNEASGALIADWIGRAPSPFEGDARLTDGERWTLSFAGPSVPKDIRSVRFFPYGNEVLHAAQQTASFGSEGASLTLTPFPGDTFPSQIDGIVVVERTDGRRQGYEIAAKAGPMFLGTASKVAPAIGFVTIAGLALLGGLVLNLMPCVLPVLSIKAVSMVHAAQSGNAGEVRQHGLFYTAGVVLSFLTIAAVFVVLRASGEFLSIGFQLQYPVGVALLALLMFAIGLWLLGLFELGGSVQNVGSGLAAKGGAFGAFFTGVLAALVGAPCIGPFLGVALGAVITQPAAIVFAVFALVGLGLALPFLALSFVPRLERFLPKPGAWMDTLKQVFAFPMFLTAAWLLSVLGDQAGASAVAWTAAGATALAFAVWLLRQDFKSAFVPRVLAVFALGLAMVLPVRAAFTSQPSEAGRIAYKTGEAAEPWTPERVAELTDAGKGAFIDFTATWCATCQLNKATTLKHADIQAAFAEKNVTFMVADFTNRNAMIAQELKKRGRPGVPMYLFYPPGKSEPKVLPQLLTKSLILEELDAI